MATKRDWDPEAFLRRGTMSPSKECLRRVKRDLTSLYKDPLVSVGGVLCEGGRRRAR